MWRSADIKGMVGFGVDSFPLLVSHDVLPTHRELPQRHDARADIGDLTPLNLTVVPQVFPSFLRNVWNAVLRVCEGLCVFRAGYEVLDLDADTDVDSSNSNTSATEFLYELYAGSQENILDTRKSAPLDHRGAKFILGPSFGEGSTSRVLLERVPFPGACEEQDVAIKLDSKRSDVYLVMWLCPETLAHRLCGLAEEGKKLGVDEIRLYAAEIFYALKTLHEKYHTTVISSCRMYILISPSGHLCLADFGLSINQRPGKPVETTVSGTGGKSRTADIFSNEPATFYIHFVISIGTLRHENTVTSQTVRFSPKHCFPVRNSAIARLLSLRLSQAFTTELLCGADTLSILAVAVAQGFDSLEVDYCTPELQLL
ncbi:hypothetical protein B0H19DRAFT_1352961 [Mycena capillaripes]|nr:hypothetical protein B0H19DRAFT_1352961 [Mycena capillaripes]